MRPLRSTALLAALPLTVLALGGAAAPTMTYHGYFTGGRLLSAEPLVWCPEGDFTGTWTVQIPRSGDMAVGHWNLKLDGKRHAVMKLPFVVEGPSPTSTSFALIQQDLPAPFDEDVLTWTLEDGDFTYNLDAQVFGCVYEFTGIQQN
ncbi:MAG TPA: hypothetical protein VLQ92_10350 [Candidatus Limnocylindrales bacterium]|nr:hypothetical protein [Candidatus Limnocylindrales bacterium]